MQHTAGTFHTSIFIRTYPTRIDATLLLQKTKIQFRRKEINHHKERLYTFFLYIHSLPLGNIVFYAK